jgi:diadenylate cyclase
VIIRKNRIVAAHAVLPLMQDDDIANMRRLGTRHRAAIGITEETDAIALVVSEENGKISIAHKGRIVRGFSAEELSIQLKQLLLEDMKIEKTFIRKQLSRIMPDRKQESKESSQDDLFSYQNKPEAK